MERVAILTPDDSVGPHDLAFLGPAGAISPAGASGGAGELAAMMEHHERALVVAALTRNHWRMTRTAEELGLERSHLYKKLKALGIDKPVED